MLTKLVILLFILMIHDQPFSEATLLEKNPAMLQRLSVFDTERSDERSRFLCVNSSYNCTEIKCSQEGPLLIIGYCATYDEDTKLLSISKCPYFEPNGYNVTTPGYIQLPRNLSQLNDYMCGPLNRKGLVCSECADGFGPSVTSFGYKCANCTGTWYGIPLFLFLEFVPITVFYLIILVFQIRVTSAPMPCFIMYAQCIVTALYLSIFSNYTLRHVMFNEQGDLELDMKILHTFYGVFNLDFFGLILPPFCINEHIKTIHLVFSGYISVFYPFFLIFLTWVCVELHGRNFRPLVWLWRPIHRCFVRLRRGWDTKSDMIDVFITFLFLSYSKSMFQSFLFLSIERFKSYNESGVCVEVYARTAVDLSITSGSKYQFLFLIPAVLNFIVYNVLLPFLLTFYPFKIFRSCLSKCRLNSITVNIFVEKVSSCYRNGLYGGRDMRSLSGFYLILRIVAGIVGVLSYSFFNRNHIWTFKVIWFPLGTVSMIAALTIALIQPYQKSYMTYLDSFILVDLALLCYLMRSNIPVFLIARILIYLPITILILTITLTKVWKACKPTIRSSNFSGLFSRNCSHFCELLSGIFVTKSVRDRRSSAIVQSDDSDKEQLPYIQPALMEINNDPRDNWEALLTD